MSGTDIGSLADYVYGLNSQVAQQTEDSITHAFEITSDGDDVCVAFLGETIFSSVEDGSEYETAKQVIADMVPSTLQAIAKIKL
jgi:hypothetical protein